MIEFGPVALFFFVTESKGFFAGTAVLIASTILAVGGSILRDGRIPLFSIFASSFVLLFGVLTLFFWEPRFLVIEYTLYNGISGVVILAGLFFGKALLKPLFEGMFLISDKAWRILSLRWSLFFIVTAIGNELAWTWYGEDGWVMYRLGAAVLLCIFGFSQFFLARKERLPDATAWGLRK